MRFFQRDDVLPKALLKNKFSFFAPRFRPDLVARIEQNRRNIRHILRILRLRSGQRWAEHGMRKCEFIFEQRLSDCREINRSIGALIRVRFDLSRFRETAGLAALIRGFRGIGSGRRWPKDGMPIDLFISRRTLRGRPKTTLAFGPPFGATFTRSSIQKSDFF